MSFESRFGFIKLVHPDLMVAGSEIKFGEKPFTGELIKQLVNYRHREFVLDSNGVEPMVINVEPPQTVLFLYKQNWRGIWACALLEDAGGEHLGYLALNLVLVKRRVTVWPVEPGTD
jgi:hypothetical protein